MKTPVRIGLIGPGSHATENLIPALVQVEDCRLVAISSRSLDKANYYAARYGARIATDRWSELLDPTVANAVIVSATPDIHAQVVNRCLERGIHVFVEKPPAPNLEVLRTLVAKEAAKPTTVVFVDFNFRYGETYQKVVELVQREGEIRHCSIRFVSAKPVYPMWGFDSIPRSLLYAEGIHPIDMAVNLLGEVEYISTQMCLIREGRLAIGMMLRFISGRAAFIEVGNYSNRFEYRIELIGSSGIVGTLEQHNRMSFHSGQFTPVDPHTFENKQTVEYEWPSLRGGFRRTGYAVALEHFCRSILTGERSSSPLSSCVALYEIIDQTLASIGE